MRVLGLGTQEQAIAEGGSGASVNFWLYLRNSILYAGLVTVGQVFFCSMAAYAFARLRWPGRNLIFGLFLGRTAGSADLHQPAELHPDQEPRAAQHHSREWSCRAFLMAPFAIFFLRQFFLGINREIEEAAAIDGAGPWRIFFRIILPMSTAPITTLGIITFIAPGTTTCGRSWSATPRRPGCSPWPSGVFRSQTPAGTPDWAGLMAATLLTAIPVLILFFAFARKIIDSIGYSGSK